MKTGEWTLRSRRVVTPSGPCAADVVIRGETIATVAEYDGPESEGVILDAGDLVVMPGLVVLHMVGPGHPDWRGFESATRDSCEGGVTTLIDLPPDPGPGPDPDPAFEARMAAAEGKIRVDCGLVVGLGAGNADRIESWIESGAIGIEASLDATEADLRAAMPILASLGRPLLVCPGRAVAWPPEREYRALRFLIRLCRETRCPVHLIHPSAIEALPLIAEARAERLPLTVETCPHHLTFPTGEIAEGVHTLPSDGRRMGPEARERLWDGLKSGLIDAVGSDHSRAFEAPSRLDPGEVRASRREFTPLRLALSAVWTEARRRGLSVEDVSRWMAERTAQAFGLSGRKGLILPGLDADLVVFDPDATFLADPEPQPQRDPLFPPIDGRMLTGRVEATILRGTLIYQDGQFLDNPKGSIVLRHEETQPIHGPKA